MPDVLRLRILECLDFLKENNYFRQSLVPASAPSTTLDFFPFEEESTSRSEMRLLLDGVAKGAALPQQRIPQLLFSLFSVHFSGEIVRCSILV